MPLGALSEKVGAAKASRVYRRSHAAVGDLARIVQTERIACGLKAKSSLYLAGDEYGNRALRDEAALRARAGLPSKFLNGSELLRRRAHRRDSVRWIGQRQSRTAGRRSAAPRSARGARIFAPVEVTDVLQGVNHVTLVSDAGVEIRAGHVVFCCGHKLPAGVPTHGAKIIST